MDKAKVKLLLEVYQPQDADDPIFAEALREVAADPELAAWFHQMRDLDLILAAKFQELPVPPEVRAQVLSGPPRSPKIILFPAPRLAVWLGALAALFMALAVAWHVAAPRERSVGSLEAQAISYTNGMPPLQFVCFDASAVADWVNHQPGAKNIGLQMPPPAASLSMAMIGSSVVQWNGHPVVMVCLQDGKRMAMLYIMKGGNIAGLAEGGTETVQKADWVVRATKSKGQLLLLATKGTPADLDFKMPLE